MESKWLLLPLLLGSAMAQNPANLPSAPLPAITNVPAEIDSMLNCLIQPECTMAAFSSGTAPAPMPHSTFVTTTTVKGDAVTVEVVSATPGGLAIKIHDSHSTVKCRAQDGTADSLTCDQLVNVAHHHHRVKLVDPGKKTTLLAEIALGIVGAILLGLLLGLCCCCLCTRGDQYRSRRTSDMPGEQSVTEITKTTSTSTAGTLGRAAEEGRSVAPFAAAGAAGAAAAESAESAGQGASGVGAETAGQGAEAGQAMGQGAEAAGAGMGTGAAAAGQGAGQGLGSSTATSVDQTGSEVVDTGSMRGRRTLRGGNQQVIA